MSNNSTNNLQQIAQINNRSSLSIESLPIKQIKELVYNAAKVKDTKSLKRKYNLDYRRKSSWIKAYEFFFPKTTYYTKNYFNHVTRHWYSLEDKRWYTTPQGAYKSFVKHFPNIQVLDKSAA